VPSRKLFPRFPYGALIIKPRKPGRDEARYDYKQDVVIQLQEWLERGGYTYPAMLMEGGLPNFFAKGSATAQRHRHVGPRRTLRRDLDRPPHGKVLLHCHIPHHTTNDNVEEDGAGGLTMIINVSA
jgi:FtsP/CotA-like multicopper oxidase with cupredoxin domain